MRRTRLHQSFARTETGCGTVLAKRQLRPAAAVVSRRVFESRVAEAVRVRPRRPVGECVLRTGLVHIVVADLARHAHPAVPVGWSVDYAILLVESRITHTLRDRL